MLTQLAGLYLSVTKKCIFFYIYCRLVGIRTYVCTVCTVYTDACCQVPTWLLSASYWFSFLAKSLLFSYPRSNSTFALDNSGRADGNLPCKWALAAKAHNNISFKVVRSLKNCVLWSPFPANLPCLGSFILIVNCIRPWVLFVFVFATVSEIARDKLNLSKYYNGPMVWPTVQLLTSNALREIILYNLSFWNHNIPKIQLEGPNCERSG